MELQQRLVVAGLPRCPHQCLPCSAPLLTSRINPKHWNPHLGACFCRPELRCPGHRGPQIRAHPRLPGMARRLGDLLLKTRWPTGLAQPVTQCEGDCTREGLAATVGRLAVGPGWGGPLRAKGSGSCAAQTRQESRADLQPACEAAAPPQAAPHCSSGTLSCLQLGWVLPPLTPGAGVRLLPECSWLVSGWGAQGHAAPLLSAGKNLQRPPSPPPSQRRRLLESPPRQHRLCSSLRLCSKIPETCDSSLEGQAQKPCWPPTAQPGRGSMLVTPEASVRWPQELSRIRSQMSPRGWRRPPVASQRP